MQARQEVKKAWMMTKFMIKYGNLSPDELEEIQSAHHTLTKTMAELEPTTLDPNEIQRRRQSLASNNELKEIFTMFWLVISPDASYGYLSKEAYIRFNMLLQKALMGDAINDEESRECAYADYAYDVAVHGEVNEITFYDMLSELIETWADMVNPKYYAAFAWALLASVVDVKAFPPKLRSKKAVECITAVQSEQDILAKFSQDKQSRANIRVKNEWLTSTKLRPEVQKRLAARRAGALHKEENVKDFFDILNIAKSNIDRDKSRASTPDDLNERPPVITDMLSEDGSEYTDSTAGSTHRTTRMNSGEVVIRPRSRSSGDSPQSPSLSRAKRIDNPVLPTVHGRAHSTANVSHEPVVSRYRDQGKYRASRRSPDNPHMSRGKGPLSIDLKDWISTVISISQESSPKFSTGKRERTMSVPRRDRLSLFSSRGTIPIARSNSGGGSRASKRVNSDSKPFLELNDSISLMSGRDVSALKAHDEDDERSLTSDISSASSIGIRALSIQSKAPLIPANPSNLLGLDLRLEENPDKRQAMLWYDGKEREATDGSSAGWHPYRTHVIRKKKIPLSAKQEVNKQVAAARAKYKPAEYLPELKRGKNPILPERTPVESNVDIVEILAETMTTGENISLTLREKKIKDEASKFIRTVGASESSGNLLPVKEGQQKSTRPSKGVTVAGSADDAFFLTGVDSTTKDTSMKAKTCPPNVFYDKEFSHLSRSIPSVDTEVPELFVRSRYKPTLEQLGSSLSSLNTSPVQVSESSVRSATELNQIVATGAPWIPPGGLKVMVSDKSDKLFGWEENRDVATHFPCDSTKVRTVLKRQDIVRGAFESFVKPQPGNSQKLRNGQRKHKINGSGRRS